MYFYLNIFFFFLFFSFKGTDLQPVAQLLLYNLFQAFQHPGSAENEYIMKGMLCFIVL